MRNDHKIHTLGAPHYKARFRFLRKLKDFKRALWSEKYGNVFLGITVLAIFGYKFLPNWAIFG